jgi:hypothetical protein
MRLGFSSSSGAGASVLAGCGCVDVGRIWKTRREVVDCWDPEERGGGGEDLEEGYRVRLG